MGRGGGDGKSTIYGCFKSWPGQHTCPRQLPAHEAAFKAKEQPKGPGSG